MKKPNSLTRDCRKITDFPLLAETLHQLSRYGSLRTLRVHTGKTWWLWTVQAESWQPRTHVLFWEENTWHNHVSIISGQFIQCMDWPGDTLRRQSWRHVELPMLFSSRAAQEDSWSGLHTCPGEEITASATFTGSKASPNKPRRSEPPSGTDSPDVPALCTWAALPGDTSNEPLQWHGHHGVRLSPSTNALGTTGDLQSPCLLFPAGSAEPPECPCTATAVARPVQSLGAPTQPC